MAETKDNLALKDSPQGFYDMATQLGGTDLSTEEQKARLAIIREKRDIEKEVQREQAIQLWSGKLSPTERKVLNYVCTQYGLDPNLRHIEVMGGNLYITFAGLNYIKSRFPEYKDISIVSRLCTKDEKELLTHPKLGECSVAYYAEAKRGNNVIANTYGCVWEKELESKKPTGTHPIQMAETRAECRVLRKVIAPLTGTRVSGLEDENNVHEMQPEDYSVQEPPKTPPPPKTKPKPKPTPRIEPEAMDHLKVLLGAKKKTIEETLQKNVNGDLILNAAAFVLKDNITARVIHELSAEDKCNEFILLICDRLIEQQKEESQKESLIPE